MIRRLLSLLRRPDTATLIARRAVRVCNREPAAAARFEEKHRILAAGLKRRGK